MVKSAVVLILNEFMEKERNNHLQVSSYERSTERQDYRYGYYERDFTMSIGKIKLMVPRTRNGDFSPSVFEKYARVDQALVLSMLEMVINGVSTRKVTHIVEQLCGEKVSKSFVSSLTEKLDSIVNGWAGRPLNTTYYPFVKIRQHIRSTNSLERLNQEVRRRERVIRIFPDTQSAFRLVGALLMQYQDTVYDKKKTLSK